MEGSFNLLKRHKASIYKLILKLEEFILRTNLTILPHPIRHLSLQAFQISYAYER
jgi:hypothetical protein